MKPVEETGIAPEEERPKEQEGMCPVTSEIVIKL